MTNNEKDDISSGGDIVGVCDVGWNGYRCY